MHILKEYRGTLVTAVIALAVGMASYAIVRSNPDARRSNASFAMDLSSLYDVDPDLIQYAQTGEIQLTLDDVRSIAVGPNDQIYVAGDQSVQVLSADGSAVATIGTEGMPQCLAIAFGEQASPGRVYVGTGNRIEVFDADGTPVAVWNAPGENPIVASIAAANQDVFVADAGNQVVLRYDTSGQVVGKIGDANDAAHAFNVPSTYFELALAGEDLLHVANPGALRVESYNFAGDLQVRWGQPGSAIENFFGCCNPSQFAVLPAGEIVTSEKGVPRIKVYSEFGEFQCVVAGPQELGIAESELGDARSGQAKAVFDVAADSQARILVLDPRRKSVRIFTRNTTETETATTESGEIE